MDSARQVVALTGAGASVPLGLPAMEGLLAETFAQQLPAELRLVLAIAQNWAGAPDARGPVDFEKLYTCVRHLSELRADDLSAIAFSPHRKSGFVFKHEGSSTILDLGKTKEQAKQLLEELKAEVHRRIGVVDAKQAADLYTPLIDLLFDLQRDVAELDVFTTNYDRSIEAIWEQGLNDGDLASVGLVRGFRQLDPHRGLELDARMFDEAAPAGKRIVRLQKLHGSLNWIRQGPSVIESPSYQYLGAHAVIYPLLKHDFADPFRDLITRFEVTLNKARLFVVIGSSLRDAHLRSTIVAAMKARPVLKVVIHDPRALEIVDSFGRDFDESLFAAPGKFGTSEGRVELRDRCFEAITYGAL